MPSSVLDLLSRAGLTLLETTTWGAKPRFAGPGLYVVSTSPDPNNGEGPSQCRLSEPRLAELIAMRPELTVAGEGASVDSLGQALRAMWPAGEAVLYVGLAGTSVAHRVGQYFSTPVGARRPHAGGWPIKMLEDLDDLHVHIAAADVPGDAEEAALRAFMWGVATEVRARLCDPSLPLPYANLELTKGLRKRHAIAGAKEQRGPVAAHTRPPATPPLGPPREQDGAGALFSLRVSDKDVVSGQIRVTVVPKRGLGLPLVRTTVSILLRGESMTVTWDPRLGPDQERSGVLRIGREAAQRLLGGPVSLSIDRDDSGRVILC